MNLKEMSIDCAYSMYKYDTNYVDYLCVDLDTNNHVVGFEGGYEVVNFDEDGDTVVVESGLTKDEALKYLK
tara:strand:- start:424 stop:636 length:213 start_codon:yes stop_codon:yes gene_type:complete